MSLPDCHSELTVVVTDSGLGGLSTAAYLDSQLRKRAGYPRVKIIYFNALADSKWGYNDMSSKEQKVAVFHQALSSMYEHFAPDFILVACNTLSVITEDTGFFREHPDVVVGIVKSGIDLMYNHLDAYPDAQVVIFGTETTIGSELYPKLLMEKGVDASRIVSEACSTLHLAIEDDYEGPEVQELVNRHVENAIQKLGGGGENLAVSLNCTHYGYVQDTIKAAFRRRGLSPIVLNPNYQMCDFLTVPNKVTQDCHIELEVLSQVSFSNEKIQKIGELISRDSPGFQQALARYTHRSDLFEWKSLL